MTNNGDQKLTRPDINGIAVGLLKASYTPEINVDVVLGYSDGDLMNLIQLLQAILWNRPHTASPPEKREQQP